MEPLERTFDLLARTPAVLAALLDGLEERWTRADEGPGTYSAFDVVGHLVHGEDTDWIPRVEHVLAHGDARAFVPFDREGMRTHYAHASLGELLALEPDDLARPARHPELGAVTLGQLLSTWVVHDLAHLAQVARVLAKDRAGEIGPWTAYFRVLGDRA
jgi:hypothetical protein